MDVTAEVEAEAVVVQYDVLKPFKTVNRRFAPGAGPGGTVSSVDDVSPHTFDVLASRKFIQEKAEIAADAGLDPALAAPPLPPPTKTAASRAAPRAPDER